MPEDRLKNKEVKLLLKIPVKILAEQELTLNEKYILGLDYALLEKLGYNNYTNKAIQDMLHIHRNLISRARIQLIKKGFLSKEKRVYRLTPLALYYCDQDDPMVYIPQWVYTMDNLTTGAKLLYAEYNAMCRKHGEYFASRELTAQRLCVSKESISKWTKLLHKKGCLEKYYHKTGYGSSQKRVVTSSYPIINFELNK